MHPLLRCLLALSTAVLTSPFAVGSAKETIEPAEAFALLKTLAGMWNGTVTEPESGPAATVVYRVTAGGSVVEERLFPGTSHEMVTMYHLDLGDLVATHYCAMGNQPRMKLAAGSTPARLVFSFVSGGNMASPDETHMHSGTIELTGGDRMVAVWDVHKDGATIGQNRFFLRRQ